MYLAIFLGWTITGQEKESREISADAIPVVDQIWPVVQKIISESVRLVTYYFNILHEVR